MKCAFSKHVALRWGGLLILLSLFVPIIPVAAQSYINQRAVEPILERRTESLEEVPEVYFQYEVLDHPSGNTVLARNTFYKIIGDGDTQLGYDRAKLVELLNRRLMENVEIGDTLVVPSKWGLDFRAYSPFPRYYPGARDFDKLFIIDKSVQAWAAYEHGQLARWGVVNTGAPESPTPTGRYNFNWKTEYRVSTLSPPGEDWEMYWVFNFHGPRGIHIHQYPFPAGPPTSHGCVRLIDADAEWIYNWADPWKTPQGTGEASIGVLIPEEPGTTVIVIGHGPKGTPLPFEFTERYPVHKLVDLPADPYAVPPGTGQQEYFDRQRLSTTELKALGYEVTLM